MCGGFVVMATWEKSPRVLKSPQSHYLSTVALAKCELDSQVDNVFTWKNLLILKYSGPE